MESQQRVRRRTALVCGLPLERRSQPTRRRRSTTLVPRLASGSHRGIALRDRLAGRSWRGTGAYSVKLFPADDSPIETPVAPALFFRPPSCASRCPSPSWTRRTICAIDRKKKEKENVKKKKVMIIITRWIKLI